MSDIYAEKDRLWQALEDQGCNPLSVQAFADFIGKHCQSFQREAIVWERELWELVLSEHSELDQVFPTARGQVFQAALSTTPHMAGVFSCLN